MECAGFFRRQHPPESFEEGERNSADDNLDDIVNELLLSFDEFKKLDKAKKEIEKKYDIKPQDHNCWPEDDIKQAWKETKTMGKKTDRKKQWARVIFFQVVKSFVCDTCKQNAAQKNRHVTTDEQDCATTPNSEDTSSQSSDKLETVGADGGDKQQTTNQGHTGSVSQGQTGTSFQPRRQSSGNDPGAPNDQSGTDGSAASERETGARKRRLNERRLDDTIYIRIPLTKMFGNKANSTEKETNLHSLYKLIDRPPEKSKQETDEETEETEIKKNRFYVMLFNKEKNHAEWVYEILNKKTLPFYYEKPKFKDDQKDPDFQNPEKRNPDYDRGHLAAAANHKWCEEAYKDTYLMSNITPQNKNLNRGAWKQLEIYCRDKIFNSNVCNVHVYTGPLYLKKEEKSGEENFCMLHSSEIDYEDGKALPTHYFKVLIVEDEDGTVSELECFWISNNKEQKYKPLDIEEIERLSGLMFIDNSPKLTEVDYTKTTTWTGNKGETSVTIDVTISS